MGLAAGQALPTFPAVIQLFRTSSSLAIAAAFSISALGQADDIELTGRPYIDMDYGPYLSASIEAAPGNIAYKGIAIRRDAGPGGVSKGSEFVLFDTDTGEELCTVGRMIGDAIEAIQASELKSVRVITDASDPLILNTLAEERLDFLSLIHI